MSVSAERLRAARLAKGFASATDAAKAFGWPVSTYLGHENGSRGLKRDAALRYARRFGVSSAWLLGVADDAMETPNTSRRIPVVGVIEFNSFRPPGNEPDRKSVPATIDDDGTTPFVAYQVRDSEHEFYAIIDPSITEKLLIGDEVVMKRKQGDLEEIAAWKLSDSHYMTPLYWHGRGHTGWPEAEIFEGRFGRPEVLGLVVGEVILRNRTKTRGQHQAGQPFGDDTN